MEPTEATYVFQQPFLLFVVLPALGVSLWVLLAVGRVANLGGPRTRERTVIVGVLIAGCAVAPARVIRVILIVLVVSVVGLVVFAVVQGTHWGRRRLVMPRIRKKLTRSLDVDSELVPARLSREVEAVSALFEQFGFERVLSGRYRSGLISSVLIRTVDGVIASAASWGPLSTFPTLLSVKSFVEGRRGVFSTVNSAVDGEILDDHLVQVYPYATPAVLIAHHKDGLRLLDGWGIRFHHPGRTDVPEILEWDRRRTVAALLERTDDEIVSLLDARVQQAISMESQLDDSRVRERVEALRG